MKNKLVPLPLVVLLFSLVNDMFLEEKNVCCVCSRSSR